MEDSQIGVNEQRYFVEEKAAKENNIDEVVFMKDGSDYSFIQFQNDSQSKDENSLQKFNYYQTNFEITNKWTTVTQTQVFDLTDAANKLEINTKDSILQPNH